MKKQFYFLFALASVLLTVSSCNNDDDDNTPQAPANSTPTVNPPSNADGAFAAVNTITIQDIPFVGPTEIFVGTAAAWFGSQSSFVDGGTVNCNTSDLTKQSNNAYIFAPTTTEPQGIDFSGTSQVDWVISGNSANNVPAFNHTHFGSFPNVNGIDADSTIDTNSDFTLMADGSVSGDSVIFVVAGPNGGITKVMGPNASFCTFTAAEMGTLGTGSNVGLLQIAPYRIEFDNSTGKNYYFIKEEVVSMFVTLQ